MGNCKRDVGELALKEFISLIYSLLFDEKR